MRAKHLVWVWSLTMLAVSTIPVLADGPKGEPADESGTVLIQKSEMDDLLLNREQYFYSGFGRRDPFGSLIKGKFASTGEGDLLDIGGLALVGVVWGDDDKFGVVQDKREHSHVLREGDRVVNGRVISISRNSLTVQHYFFGETANVTIYMNEGEDSYDAR